MTSRGSPVGAVLCCAVGGLLVLLAAGRQWAHASVHDLAAGGHLDLSVTGHEVAPSLPALGLALVALSAAIIAAQGTLRRIVGVVIVFVAAAVVGVAVTARGDVSAALERREVGAQGLVVHATANGWWAVATVGGVLAIVAGALTVARSSHWSALGARYDNPRAETPGRDPAVAAWDALDRGEDPTSDGSADLTRDGPADPTPDGDEAPPPI
jgi:uncharacterized membrane protein (TIGR02234 family)